ncbi:hypothetical protein J3L18_07280 [Mucilaginibacter gossypii]|uniref:hypothetical protein n=1 Tax=Mucilaginibacter gossypii TaxID=551996 RepID=UPI00167523CC|nr:MULTISPECIES: hypothetical protein [Mucilaginibacter]QTE38860.1 hypothetical protein J3L18_07280 [Mucilaginibacter gossypii]
MEQSPMLLVAYGFSNIIGLLILWSSFRKPWITRLALALLFAWAAWTNYTVCRAHPNTYLGFSRYAFSYLGFINGWFSLHIIQMVTAIAIGQALIAIGLAYKGIWVTLACAGAIIFFLAITPLGFGSAFPFPLLVAFATWKVIGTDKGKLLWTQLKGESPKKQF